MGNVYFQPSVDLVLSFTPESWVSIRVEFFYEADDSRLHSEYMASHSSCWVAFEHENKPSLMRHFMKLARNSHKLSDRWTKLTLIVHANGTYEYEFGYSGPRLF